MLGLEGGQGCRYIVNSITDSKSQDTSETHRWGGEWRGRREEVWGLNSGGLIVRTEDGSLKQSLFCLSSLRIHGISFDLWLFQFRNLLLKDQGCFLKSVNIFLMIRQTLVTELSCEMDNDPFLMAPEFLLPDQGCPSTLGTDWGVVPRGALILLIVLYSGKF